MPVTVAWHCANRPVLYYRFMDEWTWDEYFTALAQGRRMERSAGGLICTLNDLRETRHLPEDFIERARHISLTRPPTTGISVYISDDYHFRSIYEVIARLYPDTEVLYPLARTEDDALMLIEAWAARQN